MHDCEEISYNIKLSQQAADRYKTAKRANITANALSVMVSITSILSLNPQAIEYQSGDDLNAGIKSYEDRVKALQALYDQYCSSGRQSR